MSEPTVDAGRGSDAPASGPLTFEAVLELNRLRSARWHDGSEPWTGADWSNAMQGEAGEAGNVVKKLRRIETGMVDGGAEALVQKLADEIADTFLYLGLLADHYGIDMPGAIVSKFNDVSVREGFPERITVDHAIGVDGLLSVLEVAAPWVRWAYEVVSKPSGDESYTEESVRNVTRAWDLVWAALVAGGRS